MPEHDLYDLLDHHKLDLASCVASRLLRAAVPHYLLISSGTLRARMLRLVEALLTSLDDDQERLVAYVDHLARTRISEGHFVEEIEGALDALGEEARLLVVSHLQSRQRARLLEQLTDRIEAARRRLAKLLTAHADPGPDAQERERMLRELSRGTESAPILDVDDTAATG